MDVVRFNALLEGLEPGLDDFASFLAISEAMNADLLWKILTTSPALHPTLQHVVQSKLQERVSKINVDDHLNAITTALIHREDPDKE